MKESADGRWWFQVLSCSKLHSGRFGSICRPGSCIVPRHMWHSKHILLMYSVFPIGPPGGEPELNTAAFPGRHVFKLLGFNQFNPQIPSKCIQSASKLRSFIFGHHSSLVIQTKPRAACCARDPQGPIWCPTGVYRGPIFGVPAQVGAGNGEADTMRIACGTASAIDHPGEREKGTSDGSDVKIVKGVVSIIEQERSWYFADKTPCFDKHNVSIAMYEKCRKYHQMRSGWLVDN